MPMMSELYKEVWETFNPRSLLQEQNIALFMRSRCLYAGGQICAYVRKKNLLRGFLLKALPTKKMNLFFLNFSRKNLILASEAKPTSVSFLVLTVDTVKKNKKY